MTTQFAPGQIVRNYPYLDGSFEKFEIIEREGEVLTVYNTEEISERETWFVSQVELFEFTGKCGKYTLEDRVKAFGYEGTFRVEHFAQDYRSSTQSEWGASLVHEDGTRLFYPAHLIKKA